MNKWSAKCLCRRFIREVLVGTALLFSITGTNSFAGFLDAANSDMFVQSSKNICIVKQYGSTMTCTAAFSSGARMSGDWILRSTDRFGPISDFDGDGKNEIFVASKWGVGVVKPSGNTFTSFGLAQNGLYTAGGWKLNTFTNQFGPAADFNGDGRSEILFSSPWGLGVMYYSSAGVLNANIMVQSETRINGKWLLDTRHDHLGPVGDFDGDGLPEFLISSPWGIGILKYSGSEFASFTVLAMVKNGTVFPGGWTLNTADNRFGPVGRFDGDGTRQEILVSSSQGIGILKYSNGTINAIASVTNGTRLGGGWVVNSTGDQYGPVGNFNNDNTRDEILFSSGWGIAYVGLTGSTLFSSAMTPNNTRLSGGWVVDTKVNHFGPVGNFDNGNQQEIFVTSPWGVGFFKLSGDAFISPMLLENGSNCGNSTNNWAVNTNDNRVSFDPTTFTDISDWLAKNPRIANAVQFEKMITTTPTSVPYMQWAASEQADLATAFRNIELGQSITLADPPANIAPADNAYSLTIISASDAWQLYYAHVANSLYLEINKNLWWSLKDYNDNQVASILNSTSFFRLVSFSWMNNVPGYGITTFTSGIGSGYGVALPSPPQVVRKFLTDNSIVTSNKVSTISNLLQWCRVNLSHFFGGFGSANFNRIWQYSGVPPVSRMISGTIDPDNYPTEKLHWTAGCWGTSGFLKDVLRTVNIPVDCINIGADKTIHCTTFFSSENLYLSHGDDPYSKLCEGTFDISELLINASTFDSWFGPSVAAADRIKNVSRRPAELAVKYLPAVLLYYNCEDESDGTSHEDSEVYKNLSNAYTLSDLENMHLWENLDAKAASLGGCSYIPNPYKN